MLNSRLDAGSKQLSSSSRETDRAESGDRSIGGVVEAEAELAFCFCGVGGQVDATSKAFA